SMSSMTSGEGKIRQNIVEANLVDCMVALPDKLFYGTGVPACLWFIARDRSSIPTKGGKTLRDRRNEILFIDARKMGTMVTRKHREITDDEIQLISNTYHQWRSAGTNEYENVPGFCASTKLEELKEHDFVLTPGRYVGMAEEEDDGVPFEEKMEILTSQLYDQFQQAEELEVEIKKNLEGLGF
ncbi:MAG: N-6 DNA methylase, partial [Candidatus Marinimicrobia bacterium]|nr:N-6 DNA methylase [Candidatus Neomarinimicrobiota bacterium]